MEVRYSPDPATFNKMDGPELRKMFVIDTLFAPDAIPMVYSDIDRSITGSAVPVKESLKLTASKKEMAAEYFAERREIGVINIGDGGWITVDGKKYSMEKKDVLYIGRGAKDVEFGSDNSSKPAMFYFVSFPAHKEYPTAQAKVKDAAPVKLGSLADSNARTIYKYIFPKGIQSCQLVMGMTELEEGSVWNTMPVHTHQRRSEVYMYFNLPADSLVVHLMGEPSNSKHVIIRNQQVVLSPSYSFHSGAGTRNYSFV